MPGWSAAPNNESRRRESWPVRAADPADDYLIALTAAERAVLVSGAAHLTVLADRFPVRTPAAFLASLEV